MSEDLGIQDHLKDDVIKEALASGLDLRDYSKKVGFVDFTAFLNNYIL